MVDPYIPRFCFEYDSIWLKSEPLQVLAEQLHFIFPDGYFFEAIIDDRIINHLSKPFPASR